MTDTLTRSNHAPRQELRELSRPVAIEGRLGPPLISPLRLAAALVVAILVAGAAGGLAATQSPRYESRTTLLIDQPLAIAAAGNEGVINKLNLLRYKYLDLLPTAPLVDPVARKLGIPAGTVSGAVSGSAPSVGLTLDVTARSTNRAEARDISQAIAGQLSSYVASQQADEHIPLEQRFQFTVIQAAGRGVKVTPTGSHVAAVAAVAGAIALLIALAVTVPLEARRRRGR